MGLFGILLGLLLLIWLAFRGWSVLLLAPVAAPATAWLALPALVGLLAHEHAYVQSGQSVPLA